MGSLSSISQPIDQENKSNVDSWVKVLSITGGITAADYKLTPIITKFLIEHRFCLGNFFSNGARGVLASIVNPLVNVNQTLGRLFGQTVTGKTFVPAACEEVEFGLLFQKLALTELPREILKRVAPQYANAVDSDAAKVTRIAARALFFAYCHVNVLDCSTGGGISQLLGGALYGSIYEYSPSLNFVACINLHCLFNLANQLS